MQSDPKETTDTPSCAALGEIRDRLRQIMRRYGRGSRIGDDLASLYAEIEVALAQKRYRAARRREGVKHQLSGAPFAATPDDLPAEFGR